MIKFEELNWKELDEFDREKTVFFLPISPMEEHGPHLPLGTDLFSARDAAIGAIEILKERKLGLNCILMPSIPLGCCKKTSDFPGTISLKGKTLKNVIKNSCASLAKHGFKYIVICNSHMDLAHIKAIHKGMKKAKKYKMRICEPYSAYFYNNKIRENEPVDFDTSDDIHADFRETSFIMKRYPHLLANYKLPKVSISFDKPSALWRTIKEMGAINGYIGNPSRANKEYGEWFINDMAELYAKSAINLLEGKEITEIPRFIKWVMRLSVRL